MQALNGKLNKMQEIIDELFLAFFAENSSSIVRWQGSKRTERQVTVKPLIEHDGGKGRK